MPRHARIQPGGGVAEAFAAIFAPAASPEAHIPGTKLETATFGRPAEFAGRLGAELGPQERLIAMARGVRQFHPGKVEKLVDEDPRHLGTRAMQRNAPFAEERPGVQRGVAPGALDSQGSGELQGKPLQQFPRLPCQPGVFGFEQTPG